RSDEKDSVAATGDTQLVIVESPAKARTINKYLGPNFVVQASVGHIRDLPTKSPKGAKQPVPGVDLDNDFAPTYEILKDKAKTVAELKKAAKNASEVWFATDLDREGEAIAWHLAQVLGVDPARAKRVVFNAITKDAITDAFAQPRAIDSGKVSAQQARRILDRIVGYQASPLLWKKVARGLSAGRVQSVAVRLVTEREQAIEAFIPDENWRVTVRLARDPQLASELAGQWRTLLAATDERGKGPTLKRQNMWMAENSAIRAELWEYDGGKFTLGCPASAPADLSPRVVDVAQGCGLVDVTIDTREDEEGVGPARYRRAVTGALDADARYRVSKIETKRTTSRAPAPFITSSLQIAASNQLGFAAQRTMRLAQNLYEGVDLAKEGQVGLITYMRTDSTHISDPAMEQVRGTIERDFGPEYLPESPKNYTSSNKSAQEAHEAIRPTDPSRHPDQIRAKIKGARAEEQLKLYTLIWSRFVACQMTPAQWDATAVTLHRSDRATGAVIRATGRTLAFDGFYRATGVPVASDEQNLPELKEGEVVAPFSVSPEQKFSSPPPRFSEASLVKLLESEGIGRPSTYASIIQVIQDRNYVEQRDRRFYATDLGEVVTEKLIEAFPDLMNIGYTRQLEGELDQIEDEQVEWVDMLHRFYEGFSSALEIAHEGMTHAKAEIQPAIYACPECGSQTSYRFGKNGRFLSCSSYPECSYAAPIDRRGRPLLPERVDVRCPDDASDMELRNGRFGPFLASVKYPETTYVLNLDKKGNIKYRSIPPLRVDDLVCPKCDSPMNLRRGKRGPWLGCSTFPKCRGRMAWSAVAEEQREQLEKDLEKHEKANPQPEIKKQSDGSIIPEGTPVRDLLCDVGLATLEVHPDAVPEKSA
ncbi:MAG: DNA topoisomerase, partial [Nannocystaceae bacterium]